MDTTQIETLIRQAIFANDTSQKQSARIRIQQLAKTQGIYLASTRAIYDAISRGELAGFTVPAINIRTLTYDTSSLIFSLMKKHEIGLVIFEIARSEMEYTHQDQEEFALSVLAGALHAGYCGPVYLQADHYQVRKKRYAENPEQELASIKELISKAFSAGFYNIDIDGSTLVDLSRPTVSEQQQDNVRASTILATFALETKPTDQDITIGAEIGHIGDTNSTKADLEAFMTGAMASLPPRAISKISIQTGSSHGGAVQPDGTLKTPTIDFALLKELGEVARKDYQLAGVVQHGASTLPLSLFSEFPTHNTLEIHLSTALQNIVFDTLPTKIKQALYSWIDTNCVAERKPDWSNEQFYYKLRKKALGPNKELLWNMSAADKQPILNALETFFVELLTRLNMLHTKKDLVQYYYTNI